MHNVLRSCLNPGKVALLESVIIDSMIVEGVEGKDYVDTYIPSYLPGLKILHISGDS